MKNSGPNRTSDGPATGAHWVMAALPLPTVAPACRRTPPERLFPLASLGTQSADALANDGYNDGVQVHPERSRSKPGFTRRFAPAGACAAAAPSCGRIVRGSFVVLSM